jgi:hypothetical protein
VVEPAVLRHGRSEGLQLTQRSSGRRGSSAAKHTMEVQTPARGRPFIQYTT